MGADEERGLVFAALLDGAGGGRELDAAGVRAWAPQDGVLWVHLNRAAPWSVEWLHEESGLAPASIEALSADETRPRSFRDGDGLVVIQRSINPTPGSEPDDMVSLRMWIDATRIVSLRARRTAVPQEMFTDLLAGEGPRNAADFLVELSSRLINRMSDAITSIDDAVDAIEDEVLTGAGIDLRPRIARLRRNTIGLRRHLAPQRDALAHLFSERVPWLDDSSRVHLREAADRVTRYVEDLDAARDRSAVTQEELTARHADQMNRTMYVLSIVTVVFLPLGLLTGLLGINVGGMPGADDPRAFWFVCALLVVLSVLLALAFRWRRML